MIKAKIIKLQTVSEKSEEEMFVKSGDMFDGYLKNWPEIGEPFLLWSDSQNSMSIKLRTTEVNKLLNDSEFRTLNSIYKIVTWEEERDEKIKIILE